MPGNFEITTPAEERELAIIASFIADVDLMNYAMPSLPQNDEFYEAIDDIVKEFEAHFTDFYIGSYGRRSMSLERFILGLYELDTTVPEETVKIVAAVVQEKEDNQKQSRLATQSAIISAETYWGIGIGAPDRMYSARMEP